MAQCPLKWESKSRRFLDKASMGFCVGWGTRARESDVFSAIRNACILLPNLLAKGGSRETAWILYGFKPGLACNSFHFQVSTTLLSIQNSICNRCSSHRISDTVLTVATRNKDGRHWKVNSKTTSNQAFRNPPSRIQQHCGRYCSPKKKKKTKTAGSAGSGRAAPRSKAQKKPKPEHSGHWMASSLFFFFFFFQFHSRLSSLSSLSSYRPNTRPSSAPHRLIFLFVGASLASQRQPHFVTCCCFAWMVECARVVLPIISCCRRPWIGAVVMDAGCRLSFISLAFWMVCVI
ncbi:hypothetical protein B0T20DRAFT_182748 [Sordaria brevicollis]|uniref:Uncharacterized protein n=1 Tax=Sordaria brevicollis TaxID=83679 RepID=A0AAE0UEE1_SORBR|nr:hypothetical protein B0T20DRAFT_182748 [Sordaria brevicollis]